MTIFAKFGTTAIGLVMTLSTTAVLACPQGKEGHYCKHHDKSMFHHHGAQMKGPGYGTKPCAGFHDKQTRMQMMQKKLGLSDEQIARMQALKQEKHRIMQSLRQQKQALKQQFHALDPKSPDYKAKIFELAEQQGVLAQRRLVEKGELRYRMTAILSDEQYAMMQQLKQQRYKQSQPSKPCHHGGRGHGMMKSAPANTIAPTIPDTEQGTKKSEQNNQPPKVPADANEPGKKQAVEKPSAAKAI